jgi:hypothetical protein
MLGLRDGIDADRFSSAMVVEGEGEGEGEGAKRPKSHSMGSIGTANLNVPHFGNPQPDPCRAPSAESRLTFYKLQYDSVLSLRNIVYCTNKSKPN